MNYPDGMSRSDLEHVGEITESYEDRLEYLRNERSKSLDEIDQVNDYINELNDEIQQLEFGND
ncbi:hypothetical protein KIJ05_07815 [Leuconostoc gelidum subsp. gasicomitatum]|uniref:hypothetical protein n=1 Tax=Leuconostoc gasicomitatum TaxID=115778 RepID=UPI001CC4764E|nr:hypothetical protein [Leuconostoc gasicomitatum]MBZ5985023.1 hypothetical protein [Leuconostoc gasicomitatum]